MKTIALGKKLFAEEICAALQL